MAVATLTEGMHSITWPAWRPQQSTHTFDEQTPREVSKDSLHREMVDAYRGYRRFRKEVSPRVSELSTDVAAAAGDNFGVMLRSLESAIQGVGADVAKFEAVQNHLATWLFGALRDYETRWQDQLPTSLLVAIDEIRSLGHKWDGRSALPVSHQAIASAQRLLVRFGTNAEMFEPFADPSGSLGLEAHGASKSLYILATPSGHFTYVFRDGETTHRGSKVDLESMSRISSGLF
jgi:hypothetical protein